jgi:hypothetical protein
MIGPSIRDEFPLPCARPPRDQRRTPEGLEASAGPIALSHRTGPQLSCPPRSCPHMTATSSSSRVEIHLTVSEGPNPGSLLRRSTRNGASATNLPLSPPPECYRREWKFRHQGAGSAIRAYMIRHDWLLSDLDRAVLHPLIEGVEPDISGMSSRMASGIAITYPDSRVATRGSLRECLS